MSVDGGVDVGVADPGPVGSTFGLGAAAQHSVPTTWWHPGELLDVDVDQFTGVVGVDASDDPAGRAVHPSEPVHAVANQDPVHGRGGDLDDAGQAGRSEATGPTQVDDPALHPGWRLMRTGMGPARAVPEPVGALSQIATPPFVGALTGDVHRLRRRGDRPTVSNPQAEPKPTFRGQGSISVQGEPPGFV